MGEVILMQPDWPLRVRVSLGTRLHNYYLWRVVHITFSDQYKVPSLGETRDNLVTSSVCYANWCNSKIRPH